MVEGVDKDFSELPVQEKPHTNINFPQKKYWKIWKWRNCWRRDWWEKHITQTRNIYLHSLCDVRKITDVLISLAKKRKKKAPLELLVFPQNEKLCIVSVLKEYVYLSSTKKIRRKENQLLLSYQPHHTSPLPKTLWPDGSTELVLTLHNLVHTVHVQPAHRQRCPVACQWTLCY